MKKLALLLLLLITTSTVFSQDISNAKPYLTVLYNGDWITFNDDLEVGCGVDDFTVRANFVQDVGVATEYRVESIPYKPKPYLRAFPDQAPTASSLAVGELFLADTMIDDKWGAVQQLSSNSEDFNFSFFGTCYNEFIISTNGAVSFDLSHANNFSPWATEDYGKISPDGNFRSNPTSTTPGTEYPNSILMQHDTNPADSDARDDSYFFWDILGTTGERYFIMGTYRMPMFSCGGDYGYTTYQMVFYETTNIIEFHVQDKPLCDTWNGGAYAMGIQNADFTKGYAALGRDNGDLYQILDLNDGFEDGNVNPDYLPALPPESWRMVPIGGGATPPAFAWYKNYDNATHTGDFVSTDIDLVIGINDIPASGTITYTAEVTYTNTCDGTPVISTQDVTFTLEDPITVYVEGAPDTSSTFEDVGEDLTLCIGNDYVLQPHIDNVPSGDTITVEWKIEEFGEDDILYTASAPNYEILITNAQLGSYKYTCTVTHVDCMISKAVNVKVLDSATFDYPQTIYCANETDPIPENIAPPLIPSDPDYYFTISNEGVFTNEVPADADHATAYSLDGIIDLDASMTAAIASGTLNADGSADFVVTYHAYCDDNTSDFTVTIKNGPSILDPNGDATATPAVPPIAEITQCDITDDTETKADFDITAIENYIANGISGLTFVWEDLSGGTTLPNPMTSPYNTVTMDVKVTVTDPLLPACPVELFFTLRVEDYVKVSYPRSSYCSNETDPTPDVVQPALVAGDTNYYFTVDNSGVWVNSQAADATHTTAYSLDGLIDLDASKSAAIADGSVTDVFVITYHVRGCSNTFDMTITDSIDVFNPAGDATATPVVPPIDEIAECDTGSGEATFDISAIETYIANGISGLTFTWVDNSGGTTLANPMPSTYTTVTMDVTVTVSDPGSPGCDKAVSFTLDVQDAATGTNSSESYCVNNADDVILNLDLTAYSNGASFTWIAADNADVTGESLTLQNTNFITDTLHKTSSDDQQTVVYTVTPSSSAGCGGATFTVSVVLDPKPEGTAGYTVLTCTGSTAGTDLNALTTQSGVDAGNTYSWTFIDNTDVTGEASGTGSNLSQTLTNTTNIDQIVDFKVIPTAANGCVGDEFIVKFKVGAAPIGTDPTPTTCSNIALNVDLDAATTLTGNTYSWYAVANANVTGETTAVTTGSTIGDTLINTSGAVQTVIYKVTPKSTNLCPGAEFDVTVTVNPEPVGTDPNLAAICSKDVLNIDLTTTTTLTGNAYSWYAVANTNVTGETTTATTGTTAITDTLINTSGSVQIVTYKVTPTSADGCEGAEFDILVTVNSEPVGTDTPLSACSGDTASIDLETITTMSGTGTAYSWTFTDNTNVTGESNSTGTSSLFSQTLTNSSSANQIVTYTVTPTSTDGCIGEPFEVTVTVGAEPIGADPTPTTCSNTALSLTLNDYITNLTTNDNTFTWSATDNANVDGETTVSSADLTITDTLINTSSIPQNVVYTVIPTSVIGCVGSSFTVTVTVNPEPVGTDPNLAAICSKDVLNIDLTTTTTLTGNTYSWYAEANADVDGETTTATTGTTAITDTLINTSGSVQIVTYKVTPTSADGCEGAEFDILVTVNSEPVGTDTPLSACSGDTASIDLETITTMSGTGTAYSWIFTDNTNVAGESNSTGTSSLFSQTLTNTSSANQIVTYTVTPTSTDGCVGDTFEVTVTVGAEPVIANPGVTISESACSNTTLSLALNDYISNLTTNDNTFEWLAVDNTNVTGETTVLSTDLDIEDTLINNSNTNQDVVYTVTPTSIDGCVGDSFTITVTVGAEPVTANPGVTISEKTCSNGALNLDLNSYISNLTNNTFVWTATDNPNVDGATASSTDLTITDTLINTSSAAQDVIYTVTPTSAINCEGADFTVTVTVYPEPKAIADDTPITICSAGPSNTALNLNLEDYISNLTGNTYSWYADANANITGETTAVTTGVTAITDTLVNTTNASEEVTYHITPSSAVAADGTGGCEGNEFTITITVNPEPVGTRTVEYQCGNIDYDLDAITTLTGNTYSWYAIDNTNANVTGETLVATAGNHIIENIRNKTSLDQKIIYKVTPTSAVAADGTGGCEGDEFEVVFFVHPEPVGIPTTKPAKSNEAFSVPLDVPAIVSLSGTGNTYSWKAIDNTDPLVTGETLTDTAGDITDTIVNKTSTTQQVVYEVTPTSVNGCQGDMFRVTMEIDPEPVGTDTLLTVCSKEEARIDDLDSITTLTDNTYSWTATDNPDLDGEVLTGTDETLSQTLTNTTNSNQEIVYTVTPTSKDETDGTGGVKGEPFEVTITVHPEPVGANDTETICSDDVLNLDLNDYITNLTGGDNTFEWVAIDSSNNISGETTGTSTDSIITDTLVNVSGASQDIMYEITPTSADGCEGAKFTIKVTVGFKPVGTDSYERTCHDERLNLNLDDYTTLTGNSYSWSAMSNGQVTGETTSVVTSKYITDTISNTSGVQQIVDYIVIPTSAEGCTGKAFTISVTLDPRPDFELKSQYFICPDIQSVSIGEEDNSDNYNYFWYEANNMNTIIGTDKTKDIDVTHMMSSGGSYVLTVVDKDSGCTHTQLTSVSMAEQAGIAEIHVSDFNRPDNTITVDVSGVGDFEYTLYATVNGVQQSITQSSPIFEHLVAGVYRIEVTDTTDCSISVATKDLYVLDYPRFFTPNGDVDNDTWQIKGAKFIPNSKIYIFDRFGKVLAQLDPTDVVGWDGTYNGKQVPASDYWFRASYLDPNTGAPKNITGHFSIVRK